MSDTNHSVLRVAPVGATVDALRVLSRRASLTVEETMLMRSCFQDCVLSIVFLGQNLSKVKESAPVHMLEHNTWEEVELAPAPLSTYDGAFSNTTDVAGGVHRSGDLSTNDLQQLLMGLCIKKESTATLEKLAALVRQQQTWDPAFVLCVSDEDGCSPLHYACKSNNAKTATFLIEETNIRLSCRDHDDMLAAHYAAANQNLPLFTLLTQRSPQRLLTHDTFTKDRDTLLHYAARIDVHRDCPFVALLVRLGADPLQENALGETAYRITLDRKLCSGFYLNNYVLNRRTSENFVVVQPEDVDDDMVRVRHREGRATAADGYSAAERKTVKCNAQWWDEGIDVVRSLVLFVL